MTLEAVRQTPYHKSLSLEEISEEFDRYCKRWDESKCPQILSRMFERELLLFQDIVITQCICVALGPFARHTVLPETKHGNPRLRFNDSLRQLVALIKMLEILSTSHMISDVYFQDPLFNDVEVAFLTHLGYTVLQDPEARDKMTSTTFLYHIHCPHTVSAHCLDACFPALYIGNDPDVILQVIQSEADDHYLQKKYPTGATIEQVFGRFSDSTFTRIVPWESNGFWEGTFGIRWLKDGRAHM